MKSLDDLIPILIEKSREGKIDWSSDGKLFKIELNAYTISLRKNEDDTIISLHDTWGEVVDELCFSREDQNYEDVVELYSLARRKALKIDRAIADVERALASL